MTGLVAVAGHCPMGCGETLALDAGGVVICTAADCQAPSAVALILSDPESEHIIEVGSASFAIKHPLRERIEGDRVCGLHGVLRVCGGPPVSPGTYRAIPDTGPATVPGWRLERIDDECES